jgi:hypothetical protein
MNTLSEAPAALLHPLTRDLLHWLARTPRTYVETMEAWRSSCPRLTIWEDALADGLVAVERRPDIADGRTIAVLTERGRAAIQDS